MPSKELEGGSDYAIQITSDDPETSNYSAQFKIDSKGKGIQSTTIVPSTTRAVTAAAMTMSGGSIPTYTGNSKAVVTDEATASGVPFEGAAVKVGGSGIVAAGVAALFGVVAGGMLVL